MIGLLQVTLGLVGWAGAIFAPPMLAMTFWHIFARRHWHWVVHIVFGPFTVATAWCFARLIFWAADDDGSGPPGLGLLLIFPFVMLIGSVATYYACLAVQLVLSVWRRINVR